MLYSQNQYNMIHYETTIQTEYKMKSKFGVLLVYWTSKSERRFVSLTMLITMLSCNRKKETRELKETYVKDLSFVVRDEC